MRKEHRKRLTWRWLFRSGIAIVLLLGLSGCLLNRVVAVKAQFCDFESNFALTSTGFLIHDPVLLDSDITWLFGAQPTEAAMEDGHLRMTNIFDKILSGPDAAGAMKVNFYFDRLDDEYRLARIRLDDKLAYLLNPEAFKSETMTSAVQNICDAGVGYASTRLEMDISEQELELLPNRTEMFEFFGAPSEIIEPGLVYAYEYRLRGGLTGQEVEPGETARVVVWYDEAGRAPLRVETRYARYRTRADFVAMKMQFKLNI